MHRSLSFRIAAAATVCAAAVTATALPAHAGTLSNTDAVGDMVTFANDSDALTPAPEETIGDVNRTTLRHGDVRAAVRVRHVDLRRRAFQALHVAVVTDEGIRRTIWVEASGQRGTVMMENRRGRRVRCAMRLYIDYDSNVLRVTFPRRCAGDPRWMRFQVAAISSGSSDDGWYIDDALRDAPLTDENLRLARSARVYRGATS